MGDSIGTDGTVCWLERIEAAAYSAILDAISAGDFDTSFKCVRLLERLGVV